MNPIKLQKVFQEIQKNIRCPHCGKRYAFDEIHLINFTGSIYFLQLNCQMHLPLLATVAVSGLSIEQPLSKESISPDDIILAHKIISKAKKLKEIIG